MCIQFVGDCLCSFTSEAYALIDTSVCAGCSGGNETVLMDAIHRLQVCIIIKRPQLM
jgi:hypothetical protein